MFKKNCFAILMTTCLLACTSEENVDSSSEISCASATGTWIISEITCDGTAVSDIGTVRLSFDSQTTATQQQGDASCSTQTPWDVEFGSFDNSINLTGSGNLNCQAGGNAVTNCTSSANSCDSSTDITDEINNFSTCAISGTSMRFSRVYSASEDSIGLSQCSDGQEEVITWSQVSGDDDDDGGSAPSSGLVVVQSSPSDFGSVSVSSSSVMSLTLANTGAAAVSAISASSLSTPFSFAGGSFPGTGGDCSTSLAASASCSIQVEFSPQAAGSFSTNISFTYNDGSASQILNHGLTGTGVSGSVGILNISEGPIFDFGSQPTGSNQSHVFTVTNTGSATVTAINGSGLASPFHFQGGSYPGSLGTCGATLAAGASCTISVSFSPTVIGVVNDSILLDYNDGSSSQQVSRDITGTAVAPAILFISETDPYDFGAISTSSSAVHTFTVTNAGGFTATSIAEVGLSAPFGFLGGGYPGTGGTCGSTLSVGASCTISVEFDPSSVGVAADSIELFYNDGAAFQSSTRDVQGTGI